MKEFRWPFVICDLAKRRVADAMLQMTKFDAAALKAAYAGTRGS
jgi:hypothetical protein